MNPVLAAIAYFDLFDYPLTPTEAQRYAYGSTAPRTFGETVAALDELERAGSVASSGGYYYLAGRASIVATRADRYALADGKIKRALRAARFFSHIPFITSVSLCNNLGFFNARAEADIDLFITAKAGRLFFVRFCAIVIAQLLGMRIRGEHVADQLCLSFYAAPGSFDFSKLQSGDDVYLRYWIATAWPVWSSSGYEDWRASNGWLRDYLPNASAHRTAWHRRIAPSSGSLSRGIGEGLFAGSIGDRMERVLKQLQLRGMDASKRERAQSGDGGVVISDSMLKFHLDDRRGIIADAFRVRMNSLVTTRT